MKENVIIPKIALLESKMVVYHIAYQQWPCIQLVLMFLLVSVGFRSGNGGQVWTHAIHVASVSNRLMKAAQHNSYSCMMNKTYSARR